MAQEQNTTQAVAQAQKPKSLGDVVINRISEMVKNEGLALPHGYNHVNAIKASLLKLSETKDRSGRPFTEVCTPTSIQSALMEMAQAGLDVSKNQGYFSVYGNVLKFGRQYQGATRKIQDYFPNYTPCPRVIHQGDLFAYATDPETGRRRLVKHEQLLENIDNEITGAYLYIPCLDGGQDLYIMTWKMIQQAWMKSNNSNLTVHKQFPEKMACKTIINSALTPLLSSLKEREEAEQSQVIALESEQGAVIAEHVETETEVVEVDEVEAIDDTSVEVIDADAPDVSPDAPASTH